MSTRAPEAHESSDLEVPTPETASAKAQMNRLKGESLLLTGVYGLTALIGVGFWTIAARTVPAGQLGLNTAVISAFSAAATVAATGVANAFLAMVPIAGRAQRALLRHGYTIVIVSCLVTGAIAGIIAAMTVPKIGSPGWTILSITLASALWGVFVVQDTVLIAMGKARWLLAENVPANLLKVAALPVLAILLGKHSFPVVAATALPALLAVIVVSGFVIPRLLHRTELAREHDPDSDAVTADEWMSRHRFEFRLFAVRDGAGSSMNLALFMFLPFLVTATAGATQGAVFALCLQVSSAMDLFTVGVGVSLTTNVASDHASGPRLARMMWKRLVRIVGGVGVLVIAGAPLLLWAFGETYLEHNGEVVVVILALGSVLRTTFEVWTALLRALRHTGVLLGWSSLAAVTLFLGVIVGASLGGAVGAAIGVALATVVSSSIGGLGLLGRISSGKPATERLSTDDKQRWPWTGYEPAPMDGVIEQATWIGPEDRSRFGWVSRPADRTATLGVVLCQPIGEEARSAHRTFRRLGSELARRGILALRVDYDGTGDSVGGQHDPDRLAAWRQSVSDAVAYLRRSGLSDVAVVGMRIGATIAAQVAADEGDLAATVLWDPSTSGRTFLREGQALHALGEHGGDPSTGGDIHTPGFRFSEQTVADLRTLTLADLAPSPWCRRVLVLTRNGSPIVGKPGAALTGPHVEWGVADGQPELVGVEPNQARTPHTTVERIADWLAAGVDRTQAVRIELPIRHHAQVVDPRSGTTVRERIVELGPNRLFGIVTEPLEPAPDAPWIVLINVALEPHIGPGRRWVDFARAWSAMGLRCLRLDQSGLGDSPHREHQREDVIFDHYWLEDVPQAIDALQVGDAPVATFGLCAGALSAFEAAMRRPLDAVYAISPSLAMPQMGRGEKAYHPDRIAARPFIRPLARLFQYNTKAAVGLWRLYEQVAVWHAPMSSVRAVLRTGAAVRILSNRKDAEMYREVIWWSLVRRRSTNRTYRFDLHVSDEIDHALMTQRAQDFTFDQATRFWRIRYGLRPADPDTSATSRDERPD